MSSSLVDRESTVDLLKDLVKIDSVNPSLVKGAAGEAEIAEFLSDYMQGLGLRTAVEEVDTGRPNVVGVLEGEEQGPSLLLNGHTDTVGVDYMDVDPFNPVIRDGKLYGRGAFDMKGGLASIVAATKAVVESDRKLRGNLVISAVCDEEYASIGTERLMNDILPDAAIIGEPTELDILVAHKGFSWVEIVTRGFAAHGSQHEKGIDAIAMMGRVLVELEKLQGGLARKTHEKVGHPTLHASIIEGGSELSTYPDCCVLKIEWRTVPGEDESTIRNEIESVLSGLASRDGNFKADYEIILSRGPMEVSENESICQSLANVILEVTGRVPEYIGRPFWLDTEIIWRKGVPAVAFGPSGDGAHAAVEYVNVESVITAARVLERFAHSYLGSI
ncbi:MAG: ArgE/DapE family deacylase [Candidatus Thorarchaeota archaeon]|nr:MAG: ArgE/DapE family deacylase [Candidatus Thorarchaeota archaeon]